MKLRRAIVVESRAGLYSEGPAAAMDSQEPHLRNLLGFIDDAHPTASNAPRRGRYP